METDPRTLSLEETTRNSTSAWQHDLAALFLHAYLTFPRSKQTAATPHLDALADIDDESLREKLSQSSPHEPEVAAGYFAVCREYVPGGVNGKPPERLTPAGEVIADIAQDFDLRGVLPIGEVRDEHVPDQSREVQRPYSGPFEKSAPPAPRPEPRQVNSP